MSATKERMTVEEVGPYPKGNERWIIKIGTESVLVTPFGGLKPIADEAAHRWNTHDKLLAACKIGQSYIDAEVTGVPRPILDLPEDKKAVEAAIAAAEPISHNGRKGIWDGTETLKKEEGQ